MSKQIWAALWQFQIAITCECIYQRHWSPLEIAAPVEEWPGCMGYSRREANHHGVFQSQVRDRLFWDETLRHKSNAA